MIDREGLHAAITASLISHPPADLADWVIGIVELTARQAREVERAEWNAMVGRVIRVCQDRGWPGDPAATLTVAEVVEALRVPRPDLVADALRAPAGDR